MATLNDLFKQKKDELYGKTGKAIIESRGLINPPRAAALLTSSPNAVADLIGNQLGGALGGNPNRVSDTIFKNNTPFSKPISLFKTQQTLKDAIEPETPYYVKQSPAPASLFARIQNGGSTVGGTLANAAIKAVTKGGLKDIKKQLQASPENTFGVKFGHDESGKPKKQDRKFSKYYLDSGNLIERKNGLGEDGSDWDTAQYLLALKETITKEDLVKAEKNGHVVVTFGKIIDDNGNVNFDVPFIGAISGIIEDVTPEWTNFRYLGSPFKVNRYIGVERSIKFNLKLYYTTFGQRDIMIKKINYLKSLAFPDSNIRTIEFGANDSQYSIAPNIIKFGMGSLYKNIPTLLESLSFSIEDNTAWPKLNTNVDKEYVEDGNFIYPSVINVSIGLKVIENHKIDKENNTKVYKYDFDGLNKKDKYTIK